jgi:murein DD-endopeptidase MepM/ murein hydrolase activator NlpD
VESTIRGSLYAALAARKENLQIAADLVDIFAWDVDFHTDLRAGDRVRVLIEEFHHGKSATYHRILAAELVNQRRVLQAVYYPPEGENGAFYRPDGRAMRRMFLASPLKYARISSGFSYSRFHPILKVSRPHLGVDYAAPRGTPVYSVGDGVVEWAGTKGGGGTMLTIRHDSVYATHYLHLARFAPGVHAGTRVTQGQLIGYVGATGLATGPHLDFRLTEHGTYLNPVEHREFAAAPLSPAELPAYRAYARRRLAQLEGGHVSLPRAATHRPTKPGTAPPWRPAK